jgi:acetyl esterase/lipase
LVLVSGQYNYSVQAAEVGNRESARYVPDLTKAVKHVPPHTIVIAGDRDLPAVMPAAEAMLEALREKGASVEFFVEQDADHFDAIRGFATEGTPTATSVLEMMGLK